MLKIGGVVKSMLNGIGLGLVSFLIFRYAASFIYIDAETITAVVTIFSILVFIYLTRKLKKKKSHQKAFWYNIQVVSWGVLAFNLTWYGSYLLYLKHDPVDYYILGLLVLFTFFPRLFYHWG